MYRPDSHFMDKLHTLDPKLGCEFNKNTEKFNITYQRATGNPVPIIQVSSDRGGYRQPDRRELHVLGEGDMCKTDRTTFLNKASKYCSDYREKEARTNSDNIRNMTKDNKNQLSSSFGKLLGGKHNSTFRRIEEKPKGKVF